ncbi:MAG: CoA-binding protein [Deltaproteobacteria bacterium]|uniref:CoA-binding protein n=1 Tax=Candidatus Zymogenus saltonus TaxID=2844893 RepID=A0A9D8KGN6_9DELT|nr:CoA-binding protein [Candidatus Zymogenus saltonus]
MAPLKKIEELRPFFHPDSLAIVGASKSFRKWGAIVLHNTLLGGYKGRIYPINPKADEIFGLAVYPSLVDVPQPVDLAIIVVPPDKVLDTLADAKAAGITACVLITAGFSETGEAGKKLELEIVEFARKNGIRLIGPNCLGIVSMVPKMLSAWMPSYAPKPGGVSILSQSGNLCYTLIRSINGRGLGICRSISSGNEADLMAHDFLDYLADDEDTKVILSYIEGVRDGRAFLESLRGAVIKKPVVILKSGHTEAGSRAGASHTGAMTGSDDLYDAVFSQTGVIRARGMEEMEDLAVVFSTQPVPNGNRVGILTMGGGWGVLAADACAGEGLSVVKLTAETKTKLDKFLPPWWSRGNPVDTVAGLKEGDLFNSLETLLSADYIDSIMILGVGYGTVRGSAIKDSPYSHLYEMAEIGQKYISEDRIIAENIIELLRKHKKPIIPVVDQAVVGDKGSFVEILKGSGVLPFTSPRRGAEALSALTRYGSYKRALYGGG